MIKNLLALLVVVFTTAIGLASAHAELQLPEKNP